MGLQTVTWLLEGELLHRDSLGSEQLIRPGQLNLMTAGHGVAHAEEAAARLPGQLPCRTTVGRPALDHPPRSGGLRTPCRAASCRYRERRRHRPRGGTRRVEVAGASGHRAHGDGTSASGRPDDRPARSDVRARHRRDDRRRLDRGRERQPGHLLYLGNGRDEVALEQLRDRAGCFCSEDSRSRNGCSCGGTSSPGTRDEIDAGYEEWTADSGRFGSCRLVPAPDRGESAGLDVTAGLTPLAMSAATGRPCCCGRGWRLRP